MFLSIRGSHDGRKIRLQREKCKSFEIRPPPFLFVQRLTPPNNVSLFPRIVKQTLDIIFRTTPTRWLKGDDRKSQEFRFLLECLAELLELSKRWKFLSVEISYVTWNLRDDREKFQFENFNVTKKRAEIFSLEFGKISNFIPWFSERNGTFIVIPEIRWLAGDLKFHITRRKGGTNQKRVLGILRREREREKKSGRDKPRAFLLES